MLKLCLKGTELFHIDSQIVFHIDSQSLKNFLNNQSEHE